MAHHDASNRHNFATLWNIPLQTDDYLSVATDPSVDVVVTACATFANVDLCITAPNHGKHIMMVKPCAMTVADAERIASAVKSAGVLAVPFEPHTRFQRHGRSIRNHQHDGSIGTPISMTMIGRFSLAGAQLDWPGQPNPHTWWLDPTRVPGGGWMDHAICLVDWLRRALEDDVVKVSGISRTLVHHWTLHEQKEDFGVALLEFSRGAVAPVEVAWSSPTGNVFMNWQIAWTDGHLIYVGTISPSKKIKSSHGSADPTAWHTVAADGDQRSGSSLDSARIAGHDIPVQARTSKVASSPLDHLLDCLVNGTQPIATIDDSVVALGTCLALYEAARTGTTISL